MSTIAFLDAAYLTAATVAELLVDRGVALNIHPPLNEWADITARERLDAAPGE